MIEHSLCKPRGFKDTVLPRKRPAHLPKLTGAAWKAPGGDQEKQPILTSRRDGAGPLGRDPGIVQRGGGEGRGGSTGSAGKGRTSQGDARTVENTSILSAYYVPGTVLSVNKSGWKLWLGGDRSLAGYGSSTHVKTDSVLG